MFAFLATIMKINSNQTLKPLKVHLAFEAPKDSGDILKYEEILGVRPLFEKEQHEMYFRKSDLQIPMKAFNPETFRILEAHIREQLNRVESHESIADRVKHLILSGIQYQFPDIHSIAERLNISARTLQRQLEAESTSFKEILLETKFEMAKKLLKRDQMTISEISLTLGYSDAGNFSRSFKKQVGMSPQEFRSGC